MKIIREYSKKKQTNKEKTTRTTVMTQELSINQFYSDFDEQLMFANPNKIIMLNSIS